MSAHSTFQHPVKATVDLATLDLSAAAVVRTIEQL
jgi:hypothetical protein